MIPPYNVKDINVTTTIDENNGTGDLSLREAIIQANTSPEENLVIERIVLSPGQTYKLTLAGLEEDNSATGDLDILSSGRVEISVSGNGKATIDGGSIDRIFDVKEGGFLDLKNIVVTGGASIYGAGIATSPDSNLYITDSAIIDNITSGLSSGISAGYGIGIYSRGNVTIENSSISGNEGTGDGGGIGIGEGSNVVITKSLISNNEITGDGGGIFNQGGLNITNSTISSNVANGRVRGGGGYGGGINNDGYINLNSATITNNESSGYIDARNSGGGIYNSIALGNVPNKVELSNSIIAANKNRDGIADDIVNDLNITSQGYNLIGNATGLESIFNVTGDQIGSETFPLDPELGPLVDNGGATQTHTLLAGSPAIDKGSTDAPTQDQRGMDRVGQPDIGAYEYQAKTDISDNLTGNVMRFWNAQNRAHFFTANPQEVQDILNNPNSGYQNEGNEFDVPKADASGTLPVYRYKNQKTSTYFYTFQVPSDITPDYPDLVADGIAFNAYTSETKPADAIPIYRFWNEGRSAEVGSPVHFFTSTESNKQDVIDNYPNFKYEDAGFYAYPASYF